MKKVVSNLVRFMLCAALILGCVTVPSGSARAEDLYGRVNLTYDPTSGELEAKYIGSADLSKETIYKWYRAGSEVQNGKDSSYTPTDGGKYTVRVSDVNYEGEIESNTIMLYEVNSNAELTYNSPNALYRAGNAVRASKSVSSGQEINEWSVNVTGLNVITRDNYITFTMPAADVEITCDYGDTYQVKVYGGTSEVSRAQEGDVFTIRASSISGKTFLGWKVTGGGTFDSTTSAVTQFKMPANDVSIVGTFVENSLVDEVAKRSKSSSSSMRNRSSSAWGRSSSSPYGYGNNSSSGYNGRNGNSNNIRIADPLHTVYEVLWSNNYKVDMFHAKQGILCDMQFKSALNGDTLVLDYFNLVINNNYNIRETPTPITLRLTIPMDLQWPGRNWRMICVGRYGEVFSFPDEDIDDETITFSPDRFYAYAMAYNDNPPVEETEETTEEATEEAEEGYIEFSDEDVEKILSEDDGSSESQGTGAMSQPHSANESYSQITDTATQSEGHYSGLPQGGNNSPASQISTPVNISSDKTAAISNSKGTKVSEINL